MEEQATEIAVATAEPTIEAHPIEEMLALPEAESAVMREQARKRMRELREDFPKFLEYLYEEHRDVFSTWQTPLMDTMRRFLEQPSRDTIGDYGLYLRVEGNLNAGHIYKPPDPPMGQSLVEHMYRYEYDWNQNVDPVGDLEAVTRPTRVAFEGVTAVDPRVLSLTVEDRAAFERARQSARELQERIARDLSQIDDAREIFIGADLAAENHEPDRFDLALQPGGTTTVQVCDAEGHVVQSFQASSIRIVSTPYPEGGFFQRMVRGGRQAGHSLTSAYIQAWRPGSAEFVLNGSDQGADRLAQRQAIRAERQALESEFGLPVGTMSVHCMPARVALDAVYRFVESNPDATSKQVQNFVHGLQHDQQQLFGQVR